MPRTIKTYTDKDGKEVQFYADNCNVCQKEMVFPKADVDRVEEMFPFIKEKAERGSPCVECVMKQGKDGPAKVFNAEEIEKIKNAIMNRNKK